jgi:hypothetical protein
MVPSCSDILFFRHITGRFASYSRAEIVTTVLLPDAFVCEYDVQDGSNIRLRFRPNPSFNPPTYEARIFHGLGGQMLIDPQYKRLVALNGQMIERVEFGYDLLGYINKGGAFAIHRQRVRPTHWKTDLIDIHV